MSTNKNLDHAYRMAFGAGRHMSAYESAANTRVATTRPLEIDEHIIEYENGIVKREVWRRIVTRNDMFEA